MEKPNVRVDDLTSRYSTSSVLIKGFYSNRYQQNKLVYACFFLLFISYDDSWKDMTACATDREYYILFSIFVLFIRLLFNFYNFVSIYIICYQRSEGYFHPTKYSKRGLKVNYWKSRHYL